MCGGGGVGVCRGVCVDGGEGASMEKGLLGRDPIQKRWFRGHPLFLYHLLKSKT